MTLNPLGQNLKQTKKHRWARYSKPEFYLGKKNENCPYWKPTSPHLTSKIFLKISLNLKESISLCKERREHRLEEDVLVCVTQEAGFLCAALYRHLPKTCVQISVLQTDSVCTTLRLTCHLVIRCLESKLYSFLCVPSNEKWNDGILITSIHALDWHYIPV